MAVNAKKVTEIRPYQVLFSSSRFAGRSADDDSHLAPACPCPILLLYLLPVGWLS